MKLILVGGFIVVVIIWGILQFFSNKQEEKEAQKLLENGDNQGALKIYIDLFLSSLNGLIGEDGDGMPKVLVKVMESKSSQHLENIQNILKNENIEFDIKEFNLLKEDLKEFSNTKGMMNYQNFPVKEGKVKYAEFYQRLLSFINSIPTDIVSKRA